ncbi:hypothetical protein EDF46_1590 [Frondihabitans sp. PhB188]|uniref:hypothetical protein n=1 Tax=Frondihabitans sp. PhB188 TaxID=2485200 RepID=UPI000F45FB7F|nr:hypothetical protein [Frondihabitans sp. PhB188]ROQ39955.1 hypothetical protein EDF46_1590 [Frondihabitans sp. PhB188]
MKKVSGTISHPLTVEEPIVLTGVAPRGALVCEGGSLDLRGVVGDRLTIEPGGYVLLSGTCDATVTIHSGGLLEVAGTLNGRIARNDGEVWAMVGSTIQGRLLTALGLLGPLDPEATVEAGAPRFRLTSVGGLLEVVP